jgi:hypothetical protein
MSDDVALNEIGVLRRREIEARILAPVIDALAEVFGRQLVLEVAERAIAGIARQQGRELAAQLNDNSLVAYGKSIEPWTRGGSLELRILDQSGESLSFDVTRCKYAELYRELGIEELGGVLSCSRDAAFVEGFNAEIHLERAQTILQGATHCDFRYSSQSGKP